MNKTTHISAPWTFLLINAIFFILLSAIAFYYNLPYLFYAEDGHYMMNLAREDHVWRGFEFGLTNNFLQSLWSVWFPVNTKFFPGFLVASLFDKHIAISQIAAYTVFAFEFFIITLMVSRLIRLSWNWAVVSAWIMPLLAYPYYYYPILYNITSLAPQIGTIIAATNLIIILFIKLGRLGQSRENAIGTALGIALLSLYIVFSIPVDVILSAPIIVIFCSVYWVLCESTIEKKIKLKFSSIILLFLVISGAPFYIYGLTKYSVSYYLADSLRNGVQTIDWSVISILFHGNGAGESWLCIFGILGIIISSFYGENFKKTIARAVLAVVITIFGFGILLVKFNLWSGPVPLYYEFLLWPFYMAYSVTLFSLILKIFSRWETSLSIVGRAVILLLPWSIFLLAKPVGDIWNIPNPPVKTAIVDLLNEEISIFPGKVFQGRVANFTGQNISGVFDRGLQAANDNLILRKTGNDHRMNGLWFYNIPTLDTCTQLISPIYFQFAKSFFALPKDHHERGAITLRKPDVRWLAALGVKFIVIDAPLQDAKQRKLLSLEELGDLYLYEISNPNRGQYSPTHVIKLSNTENILTNLHKESFDPSHDVITDAKLPERLTQALNGKIIVDKGFFNVSALSAGYSVILLPLEYSHCLNLKSNVTEKLEPMLFRANMTQAGVLFYRHLDASIKYYTGPFHNATCRLRDAKDFENNFYSLT